jgi:hypothetical protein
MKNVWIIGVLVVLGAIGLILGLSGTNVLSAGDFSLGIFNIGLIAIGIFMLAWKKCYAKVKLAPEEESEETVRA